MLLGRSTLEKGVKGMVDIPVTLALCERCSCLERCAKRDDQIDRLKCSLRKRHGRRFWDKLLGFERNEEGGRGHG